MYQIYHDSHLCSITGRVRSNGPIFGQSEKSMRQLHSIQSHQHAHPLAVNWILQTVTYSIHTWTQLDIAKTSYDEADRMKSVWADWHRRVPSHIYLVWVVSGYFKVAIHIRKSLETPGRKFVSPINRSAHESIPNLFLHLVLLLRLNNTNVTNFVRPAAFLEFEFEWNLSLALSY